MALNCEWSREALRIVITEITAQQFKNVEDELNTLAAFIDDVEVLMKYNSIKQTPALFKPKEKGS